MSSSEGEDLDIEDFLEVRILATLQAPETVVNLSQWLSYKLTTFSQPRIKQPGVVNSSPNNIHL